MSEKKKKAKKPPEEKSESKTDDPIRKRKIRGLITAALGLIVTFLLMAHVEQIPHGVIFGFISLSLGVFGILEFLGLLHVDGEARKLADTPLGRLPDEPVWAQPLYTVPLAFGILLFGSIVGGYETLPWVIAASLFVLFPSALKRPGLLVFVVVGFIYLPKLGTFGLWDPWETHYGEVAREIVARDDYISLWWAQENWFWSKPILIFWSESLTFNALNLPVMPDSNPAHPEWAVRLPVTTFSIVAVMVVYATIRKLFSQRAGAIAAIVLATMPHYFFLSHQAITDMYLVSNLVMAVCMLMLAFATDPEEKARVFAIPGGRTISFQTIVLGGLMMLILPQALYMLSLNVEFFPTEGFRILPDTFMYGSAGNPGGLEAGQVPGNPPHRDITPHVEALQPALQGLFWGLGLMLILWMLRKEKRSQALYMTAFYAFCALSFMGKGIPGVALPGLVALFYLIASRRWNVLFEGRLRVAPGILIVSCIGLPWYIAMYIRHGPGFTDRLLVHDHLNRLAAGVHGDTGSIQYFIWQLGYATFPWVALIPAAALAWVWLDERRAAPGLGAYRTSYAKHDIDNRKHTLMLIGIWFFAAFTLFSAMITKFHHYIFPAVPPAAILVGLFVDRLWGHDPQGDEKVQRKTRWATVAALVGTDLSRARHRRVLGGPAWPGSTLVGSRRGARRLGARPRDVGRALLRADLRGCGTARLGRALVLDQAHAPRQARRRRETNRALRRRCRGCRRGARRVRGSRSRVGDERSARWLRATDPPLRLQLRTALAGSLRLPAHPDGVRGRRGSALRARGVALDTRCRCTCIGRFGDRVRRLDAELLYGRPLAALGHARALQGLLRQP